MTWDLDLNIGAFDLDTGTHDGDITWDLRLASERKANKADQKSQDIKQVVVEIIRDREWELTKSQVVEQVGGNKGAARKIFQSLAGVGVIVCDKRSRKEGEGHKSREVWGLRATTPDEPDRVAPCRK